MIDFQLTPIFKSKKDFNKFIKKTKNNLQWGMVRTINECMFTFREFAIDEGFNRFFVIRSKPNIRKHMWVKKAKRTGIINGSVGTTHGPRFTGFVEQQYGTKTKRDKTATPHARGGSLYGKKKIPPKFRTKPGNSKIRRMGDLRGKQFQRGNPAGKFLAMLQKEGYSGPAKIEGHNRMPDGIYMVYKNGKPKLIQVEKELQPKEIKWVAPMIIHWRKNNNIQKIFEKEMRKILTWK